MTIVKSLYFNEEEPKPGFKHRSHISKKNRKSRRAYDYWLKNKAQLIKGKKDQYFKATITTIINNFNHDKKETKD